MTWLSNIKSRIGYYEKTSKDAPSELLIDALHYVKNTDTALDLGCGAGVEVKELARRGFKTTAIDVSNEVSRYFSKNDLAKIKLIIKAIEDFKFDHYDFIFAKNSLVFLSPKKFEKVINSIKVALNNNGVFAGRLWGIKDSENRSGRNYKYSFLTTDKLKYIFNGYKFLLVKEFEEDGINAHGKMKHWHFIDVIVQKT